MEFNSDVNDPSFKMEKSSSDVVGNSLHSSPDSALKLSPDLCCGAPAETPRSKGNSRKLPRSKMTGSGEEWLKPFELGWKRELVQRNTESSGSSKGPTSDVYYFTPDGKKMRSSREIDAYLSKTSSTLLVNCFTFVKTSIYKEPHEIIRSAGKRHLEKAKTNRTVETTPSLSSNNCSQRPKSALGADLEISSQPAPSVTLSSISAVSVDRSELTKDKLNQPVKQQIESPHPLSAQNNITPAKTAEKRKQGKQSTSNVLKRQKTEQLHMQSCEIETGDSMQCLCSLSCPKLDSVPPSLPCQVCMCMFHPECVGQTDSLVSFTCLACIYYSKSRTEPNNNSGRKSSSQANAKGSASSRPPLILGNKLQPRIFAEKAQSYGSCDAWSKPDASALSCSNSSAMVTSSLLNSDNKVSASIRFSGKRQCTLIAPLNARNIMKLSKLKALNVGGKQYIAPKGAVEYGPNNIQITLSEVSTSDSDGISSSNNNSAEVSLSNVDVILPDNQVDVTATENRKKRKFIDTLAWQNAFCNVNKFHVGYDSLLRIFSCLDICDCLRVREVCRTWKEIATHPALWRTVQLKECTVLNWHAAFEWIRLRGTWTLDLRQMNNLELSNGFLDAMENLPSLSRLELPPCSAAVVQSVADRLTHLLFFSAENICDARHNLCDNNTWSLGNICVDMAAFSVMKNLEVVRLRALGNIVPCNISKLGLLENLKILSLTSLQQVPGKDLNFLGSLKNLQVLELGDCHCWEKEVFEVLRSLSKLQILRLEGRGEEDDPGLGEALIAMTQLRCLELVRYNIGKDLSHILPTATHLKRFTVWSEPMDNAIKTGHFNSNILSAVCKMDFLKELNWTVILPADYLKKIEPITIPLISSNGVELDDIKLDQIRNMLLDCLQNTQTSVLGVPLVDSNSHK